MTRVYLVLMESGIIRHVLANSPEHAKEMAEADKKYGVDYAQAYRLLCSLKWVAY